MKESPQAKRESDYDFRRQSRDFSPEVISDGGIICIDTPSPKSVEKQGKRIKWADEEFETIKFFKITD